MHSESQKVKLAVIGAGSWGTVLAYLLANNGHDVKILTRTKKQADTINKQRFNYDYFPNLKLPKNLLASHEMKVISKGVSATIIAVPSKYLKDIIKKLPESPAIISAVKALYGDDLQSTTKIIQRFQPDTIIAALSGPNIAIEIANSKPSAATIASTNTRFAKQVQLWFTQNLFRVYSSNDLIGLEIAGAMKNIIAIATGMSDALGLGSNSKAAIITRGLAEMSRLGIYKGGKIDTFYGLPGLGDTIGTAYSVNSRNYSAGSLIIQGKSINEIANKFTVEGIQATKVVYNFAKINKLELPIVTEVYNIIYDSKDPMESIRDLMSRGLKIE